MKPPIIPSLERGETHQITPWKLAQRGRQENKHTPGPRSSKTKNRFKKAKRRPKLGVKNERSTNYARSVWIPPQINLDVK